MFNRIGDAILLLRRFPQLIVLPVVLWLGDKPLDMIVPGLSSGSATVNREVFLARAPLYIAALLVFALIASFLEAGQVHGFLSALDNQRLTWPGYWSATRRYGLRLLGLTLLFGFLVIISLVFTSFLFVAFGYAGAFLASLCVVLALVIYALAMILLVRDDLSGGDALGAAWRFAWGHRGPVGGQTLAIFLCFIGIAIIASVLSFIPGVTPVGGLLGILISNLLPLIVFADLLRTHPVPPPTAPPPSPF